MSRAVQSARGVWRYSPGYWERKADLSIVERVTCGRRKGVWRARPAGSKSYISIEGSGLAGFYEPTWQGYSTANQAMAAVDKYLDAAHAKLRDALAKVEAQ